MTDWTLLTDGDLIGVLIDEPIPSSAADKQAACTEIYNRFRRAMYAHAHAALRRCPGTKVSPDDIVQGVFAHLLQPKVARQFIRTCPLRPWLLTLVWHYAISAIRRERRQPASPNGDTVADPRAEADLKHLEARDEVARLLAGRLTPWQRDLLQRVYLEEQSLPSVAQALGCDIPTLYRELHRLRTRLRSHNRPRKEE